MARAKITRVNIVGLKSDVNVVVEVVVDAVVIDEHVLFLGRPRLAPIINLSWL
jgi:hypothetical protein